MLSLTFLSFVSFFNAFATGTRYPPASRGFRYSRRYDAQVFLRAVGAVERGVAVPGTPEDRALVAFCFTSKPKQTNETKPTKQKLLFFNSFYVS